MRTVFCAMGFIACCWGVWANLHLLDYSTEAAGLVFWSAMMVFVGIWWVDNDPRFVPLKEDPADG